VSVLNQEISEAQNSLGSRIFAYIICINEYKEPVKNLQGCEKDGRDFANFLKSKLGVPESRIKRLIDEAATHESIIELFEDAAKNSSTHSGDPVIFFYAGHGGRVPAPKDWKTDDNHIEVICPHDIGTVGGNGKLTYGIPDFVIASLLRKVATKKGGDVVSS
jgi:hypothetical protein